MVSDKAQRYEVKQRVAEGRTVVVARALDRESGREVTLKTLRDDHATYPERVAAFSTSSKLAASLLHASLVPVIAARRVGARIYTVSPWVSGIKLTDLPLPLDVPTAASVVSQIAEGMAVAHATGIILRGINPRDFLIRSDGQVLLIDLNKVQMPGMSGPLPPAPSRAEVIRYLPMEARSGGLIDGQTDIFALGAMTLELLTGVPPTPEGAVDMKPAVISTLTAQGPAGQLAKIAMTLAAPRADQRPQSVANLTSQLETFWTSAGFASSKAGVLSTAQKFFPATPARTTTGVTPAQAARPTAPGAPASAAGTSSTTPRPAPPPRAPSAPGAPAATRPVSGPVAGAGAGARPISSPPRPA
ncbi:MAG: protein kinase, partial [Myxococcota bacterium]